MSTFHELATDLYRVSYSRYPQQHLSYKPSGNPESTLEGLNFKHYLWGVHPHDQYASRLSPPYQKFLNETLL